MNDKKFFSDVACELCARAEYHLNGIEEEFFDDPGMTQDDVLARSGMSCEQIRGFLESHPGVAADLIEAMAKVIHRTIQARVVAEE